MNSIDAAKEPEQDVVGIFPVRLPDTPANNSFGGIGKRQALHAASSEQPEVLCRELSQAVAQLVGDPFGERLKIFISHTKRHRVEEEQDHIDELVDRVRAAISGTHLQGYFDTADLQPGEDWEQELKSQAASSALLAVRTDLYASREWCQRELLVAKRADMPIVTLNGVQQKEERGSFLLDHVPSVVYRQIDEELRQPSIEEALNLLVDAALARALWGLQKDTLAELGVACDWAPSNAPEPVTVLPWLLKNRERSVDEGPFLIMHPDPPLGLEEAKALRELFEVAGIHDAVDIVTPQTYKSRTTTGF
ncbi:MAG: toll/interleukin-1 receptor domain-containing protein [Acidimicrobiaceae bacterium]|nr:toll/interleukin-1 receptor domain-containing protein [Acidimicrobiaceae bacterium]MCY4281073.1 toll/interleukin-1 receptor domain-containing protein [Acidimicrobiaceae bacterium]